ncbi:MAG TPA: hypothetical protein VFC35_00050 [Gemmatimonadaceae bacterium]|nr:hypothetical protein [Gemmatimonadaceae bacterium]
MPITAQEVAVEVVPERIDQASHPVTVCLGDKRVELTDLAFLPISQTDNISMLKVGDEKNLTGQELRMTAAMNGVESCRESTPAEFRNQNGKVLQ